MSDDYRSRQERRQKQPKKHGLLKKIFLSLCILILLMLVAGGVAVFAIIHNAPKLNPALLDAPLSTTIYDKDDHAQATLFHKEKRSRVDIKNVPKRMKDAVISIEDQHFYQHHGIDIRRTVGAALADLKKGRFAEGGSTITQQVIKRSALSSKKTFTRKIQEAYLALELENKYSKDQILEMYLNKIYYGNQAYGVATAADTYFGTNDLNKLNLAQTALLAGLPNAPSTYDPFKHPKEAAQRRDQVLQTMLDTNAITQQQAQKAKSKKVKSILDHSSKDHKDSDKKYKAFEDTVYHELVKKTGLVSEKEFFQGGLKIYTTLDSGAQSKVYDLLKSDQVNYPDKYFNAGMTLLDTQSGAVRAVGGGRQFHSIGDYNYGSNRKRSPGSTIKPVIDYGPAVDYLKWSTYHPVVDEPFHFQNGTDLHNWDGDYKGKLTLRKALAMSRNVPAAKTFEEVGHDKAKHFAQNLGITFKGKTIPDASSIGSFRPGATPMQMAGAFAAFGNKGVYHKPYTVRKVVFPNGKTVKPDHKTKDVMHDYTAYMITDMLKSVVNKDYGTGNAVNLPGLPVAGKTGSVGVDKDKKEKYGIHDSGSLSNEWFTGYTTQYTASVWTGYPRLYSDGKTHYIGGDEQNLAIPLFNKLMSEVSSQSVSDFKMPGSVAKHAIDKKTGKLASDDTPSDRKIRELFVEGHEPTEEAKQDKEEKEKPDAPKHLKAKYDHDDQKIKLDWDYDESDDVAFEVQQAIDDDDFQKADTTDDQSFTVDHPDQDSTYRFKVYAVDKDTDTHSDSAATSMKVKGESGDDEENDQEPETPQHTNADYDKDQQHIHVSWDRSDGDDISYRVEQSKNDGAFQPLRETDDTQTMVQDLEPDTRYRFRITAINTKNKKESDSSTTNSVKTEEEKAANEASEDNQDQDEEDEGHQNHHEKNHDEDDQNNHEEDHDHQHHDDHHGDDEDDDHSHD